MPADRSQGELAAELSRLLEAGGHRAGALLVTRAPLPGTDASTRIVSAVGVRELDAATALDLIHLVTRLRSLADELEALTHGKASP